MSARADLKALRRHRVPAWWSDAKLGIFIHWTPASVPGFAPVDSHIGELLVAGRPDALAENPYTEWYENSLRFPDSSASRHHRETYGTKPYAEFRHEWEEALVHWDPDGWARTFAATGARYVVLVSKHHDGFCLWPSEVAHPFGRAVTCGRDVVGELREAVLGAGMRFGLYYSGGLDWTFEDHPIGNLGDMLRAVPRGPYPAYAEAHVRELVARYRPSVLWNDIFWPAEGGALWRLMADYYRDVPDGVVNDRWMPWSPLMLSMQSERLRRLADQGNARFTRARGEGGMVPPKPPHFDYRTPEYALFDRVPSDPWESVRGMDQSFGYNRCSRESDFLTRDELLDTLVGTASAGGNLLLNVGPRGEDAAIPDEQLRRLEWLAEWTGGPGRGVFGSRPWVRVQVTTPEGLDVAFTAADTRVHALVKGRSTGTVSLPGVAPTPGTEVSLVDGGPLEWREQGGLVRVTVPEGLDHPVLALDRVDAVPI